jgi:hypothetical protein
VLNRERELMRKHVKKVGWKRILLMYALVLVVIIIIEAFASLNIYLLRESPQGVPILRDVFSVIAIIVAAFTIIANLVFLGGRSKADREFHYFFSTRPLLLFSGTAIIGDIVAVFLVGRAGFAYIVFFSSLIALNIFAIGYAVYCTERALSRHKRTLSL